VATTSTSKPPPSDVPRNRAQLVQIDVTEPAWVKALPFEGATVQVAPLPVGDLMASTSDGALLLIERKSAGDLLQSVRDGRILAQASEMADLTPWCYVVITEPMYPSRRGSVVYEPRTGRTLIETGWSWSALQGVLTTVQELGVGVVQAAGAEDYGPACLRLCGRMREAVPVARRDAVPMDDATRILTAIPGVGAERARALLRECGSAAAALWALTDTPRRGFTKNVIGVGPGTRFAARQALGLEAGWVLRPAREEDGDE
jgi:ERCC4-type nuclease